MLVDGNPLAVRGFNQVGLRRRDFSAARISGIKQMHKLLYRQGLTLEQARTGIDALAIESPECADDVALMSRFLSAATRGIAR
jgi:UDP-N-acetylglucosamine acyltransferase